MGHAGQVAMHSLAHPGPPLFFLFFFLFSSLPAWQFTWAGPFHTQRGPRPFPPRFSFENRFKFFSFASKNQ
jgi:hypothetical protein